MDFLEGGVSYLQAPVVKVKFEFLGLDAATLVFAESVEGLSDCFPLEGDLIKQHLDNILLRMQFLGYSLCVLTHFLCVLIQILFELGVLDRVMAKVEALHGVNRVADPLGEVLVAEIAPLIGVSHLQKHLQFLETECIVRPKVPYDIFCRDIPVMVDVQIKESFTD